MSLRISRARVNARRASAGSPFAKNGAPRTWASSASPHTRPQSGFYLALALGQSIERAFALGCVEARLDPETQRAAFVLRAGGRRAAHGGA